MNLLTRFQRIFITLVFTTSAVFAQEAGELQELVLTGDLFGRSSLDFRQNAKNVQFTIPEGSQGTVLETRKLARTGSYGIKVRLTKVNGRRGKNTPNVGDETWVYFSQKDPWLTLKDKDGSEVDDPEIALFTHATKDGKGLPAEGALKKVTLPTRAEVLRDQKKTIKSEDPNLVISLDRKSTEGGFCPTCNITSPTVADKNQVDLKNIPKELSTQSTAPSISDANWNQFPKIVKYSTSRETEKAITYGLRNKESRSKRLCYRYVKRAILGGGLVDDYLPGAKAHYGVSDLKRRGFKNMLEDPRYKKMITSPESAPKGAILVYRNSKNKKHPGHIEIKTDWGSKGGYVSDFYRDSDTKMYNRELIGVMIKETL